MAREVPVHLIAFDLLRLTTDSPGCRRLNADYCSMSQRIDQDTPRPSISPVFDDADRTLQVAKDQVKGVAKPADQPI